MSETAAARRAIVTGSDSGIGRAAAVALAEAGYDVGITWHEDREGAAGTAAEVERHGRRAVVEQLDLADAVAAAATIRTLVDALGGLDLLVNNAGGAASHPFLEYPLADWQAAIDVNLTGTFACAQAGARVLVAGDGGAIVNVTSVHEHIPLRDSAAYCAAKGGLGLLTKVMAIELAEHDITVNAVAPGEIATPMTGNEDVPPDSVERPMIPAGRPGDAREIAAAIVFLASPGGRYVTGESLVIDGGLSIMGAEANRIAGDG
ncbi:MAG TPA: SDR family oxidoreductase [Thermoleophilaceae bacterium]|nr:SDR family oxidoreductase [Thermoleophilaceae bacterium]